MDLWFISIIIVVYNDSVCAVQQNKKKGDCCCCYDSTLLYQIFLLNLVFYIFTDLFTISYPGPGLISPQGLSLSPPAWRPRARWIPAGDISLRWDRRPATSELDIRGRRETTITSLPCLIIESLQQAKQNLWVILLGHCTKWVSSSFPLQLVHLSRGAPTSLLPLLELDTWSGLEPGVGGPLGPVWNGQSGGMLRYLDCAVT